MAQVQLALPFHPGETHLHHLLKSEVSEGNPTNPRLSPAAALSLQTVPLLAVGALDADKRPWTTLWGGSPGFAQPLGNGFIAIRVGIDAENDVVVRALLGEDNVKSGELLREEGKGRMVSGLTINFEGRKRQKLFGRMVAGSVVRPDGEQGKEQLQLIVRIEQSLGNCPKYINCKDVSPLDSREKGRVGEDGATLGQKASALIARGDVFFISSANRDEDMDTNHRGGPVGFVRTTTSADGKSEIVWPEYSGNRLYQTLGNLWNTPRAGLVFPDLETGDALYVTGDTEILVGEQAAKVIPRSNLAVRLTVVRAVYVEKTLTFRGVPGEMSPYNPRMRPLASEANIDVEQAKEKANTATLISKTDITPTIARFKFSLGNPATWKAGAWVAFDFAEDLYMGYSHMNDEDPTVLNDDFIRTFTVSSPPSLTGKRSDDEFEITIRKVGRVTEHMFRMLRPRNEVTLRGFGGEFEVTQEEGKVTPFVAGGVGITPIMALLPQLDKKRLKLFWTMHFDDLDLAFDLQKQCPGLEGFTEVFLTGATNLAADVKKSLEDAGFTYHLRRLQKDDLYREELSDRWYTCVSNKLQPNLIEWLPGKQVIFESFNF